MKNKIRPNSEKNTKLISTDRNNSRSPYVENHIYSETIPAHLKEYVNLNHSSLFIPLD
ncbi:MAG: hypothetical protein H7329_05075 [Opitutaceae bacterium]|nr:hypothetical protein [Cytophagales bacterium]